MVFEPLDLALRRIMRVMRVSDMNNQRHNDNCYMMSKVIRSGHSLCALPNPYSTKYDHNYGYLSAPRPE